MAKVTKRMAQVAEEIRHRVAMMLAQGQVADPGVRGVTIQSVRISPDLQVAKVYYTVLGGEKEKKSACQALARAKGYIRKEAGRHLGLYHVPEVVFIFDDIGESASRIHCALAIIKAQDSELEFQEASPGTQGCETRPAENPLSQ